MGLPEKQGLLAYLQPLSKLPKTVTSQKMLQVPSPLVKSIPHPQRGGLRSAKLEAIRKLLLTESSCWGWEIRFKARAAASHLYSPLHLQPSAGRLLPFPRIPFHPCEKEKPLGPAELGGRLRVWGTLSALPDGLWPHGRGSWEGQRGSRPLPSWTHGVDSGVDWLLLRKGWFPVTPAAVGPHVHNSRGRGQCWSNCFRLAQQTLARPQFLLRHNS